MLKLIKKDLSLTRFYLILTMILTFLFSPLIFMLNTESMFYIIFTIPNLLVALLCTETQLEQEKLMNVNTLILSLPIKRSDIVISKYLTASINQIIYAILFFLLIKFQHLFTEFGTNGDLEEVSFKVIFFALSISIVYLSMYLPIYYRFKKYTNFFSLGVYVLIFFSSQIALQVPSNISNYTIILLPTSILLYLASMKLSIRLFEREKCH
ncbi:MAG: ABC-2 transporter permease [Tissierellia bacterium]|nr:ABC-2 transporter permease [Tissierellia bacterium]